MESKVVNLLRENKDRIDIISNEAGAAGEYMATIICEMSNEYQDLKDDGLKRWNDTNRWAFPDTILENLILQLGMYTMANNAAFNTWEEIDRWIVKKYSQEHISRLGIQLEFALKEYPRLLFRTHGLFMGGENLFNHSRKINIWGKSTKWRVYIRQLTNIKIFAYKYKHVDIKGIEKQFNILKKFFSPMIDDETFFARLKKLKDSGVDINAHSIIGMTSPDKMFRFGDRSKYSHEEMLNSVLSVDPIEFNTLDHFWNKTIRGEEALELHNAVDTGHYRKLQEANSYICLHEALYTYAVSDLYKVDRNEFRERVMSWHKKNMDLIKESEKYLGKPLLNPNWDMTSK